MWEETFPVCEEPNKTNADINKYVFSVGTL